MQDNLKVRIASADDAAAIAAIYAPYVENTEITFEYTAPYEKEFRERITATLERYPYLVAEKTGRVSGYAYASRFKSRDAYDWAVETSIYIKQDSLHAGIGSALYNCLERILKQQHITNMNACITYPNPASISFHEKHGYIQAARFSKCGYKHGIWKDVIWMEKFIAAHDAVPLPFIPFRKLPADGVYGGLQL